MLGLGGGLYCHVGWVIVFYEARPTVLTSPFFKGGLRGFIAFKTNPPNLPLKKGGTVSANCHPASFPRNRYPCALLQQFAQSAFRVQSHKCILLTVSHQ